MFRFKLQTVLDVRIRAADEAKARVAQEERKLYEIHQKIVDIDETMITTIDEHNELLQQSQAVDPMQARWVSHYLSQLRHQRTIYESLKTKQSHVVNIFREDLRQALVRQKALETLKEKAEKQFKKDQLYQEELMLSEMAAYRAQYGHPMAST